MGGGEGAEPRPRRLPRGSWPRRCALLLPFPQAGRGAARRPAAAAVSLRGTMELSPSSGGAAEALSWPEMFPGLESDSPLPPEDLDAVVPVSGAVAGGMLDRILLESVCQQQSWVRVYGKDRRPASRRACLPFAPAEMHPPVPAPSLLGPFPTSLFVLGCISAKFVQTGPWGERGDSVWSLDLFEHLR